MVSTAFKRNKISSSTTSTTVFWILQVPSGLLLRLPVKLPEEHSFRAVSRAWRTPRASAHACQGFSALGFVLALPLARIHREIGRFERVARVDARSEQCDAGGGARRNRPAFKGEAELIDGGFDLHGLHQRVGL